MAYRCRYCSEQIPQADSVCPKCGYNNGADTMEAVLGEMLKLYGQKEFCSRTDMASVFGDLAPELQDERLMLQYLYEVDGPAELFASIGRPAADAQLYINWVISRLKSKFISEKAAREICSRFLSVLGGSMPKTEEEKPPRKWMIPAIACAALLALVIGSVTAFGGQGAEKPVITTSPVSAPTPSASTVSAKNKCGENVWWELEDGVLTISGSGAMEDYPYINGYITSPWKEQCKEISSIIIKDGVTTIGSRAFYGLENLTDITIPNSVTKIGDCAFEECRCLTGITIPNSVTEIDGHAFWECSGLTGITIPASVTEIGAFAFSSCVNLTSVTLPGSLTKIDEAVFYACESLAVVTIPDNVLSIGELAFAFCTGLTDMIIPESVTTISESAFRGCSSLTSISIPYGVTIIDYDVFSACSSLVDISLPDSVTKICASAFDGCSSLTSITIPQGVTELDWGAFENCSSLTSITLPNSVAVIEESVFFGCDQLTICAPEGSTAQSYAQKNGIPFLPLSKEETDYSDLTASVAASDTKGYARIGIADASASTALYSPDTKLTYYASWVLDGDLSTCWQEGGEGYGIGEYMDLYLESEADISALTFQLGNAYSQTAFNINSRPSELEISFPDGSSVLCQFPDRREEYMVKLSHPVSCGSFRVTIMDAYGGSAYKDTCITEVRAFSKTA